MKIPFPNQTRNGLKLYSLNSEKELTKFLGDATYPEDALLLARVSFIKWNNIDKFGEANFFYCGRCGYCAAIEFCKDCPVMEFCFKQILAQHVPPSEVLKFLETKINDGKE